MLELKLGCHLFFPTEGSCLFYNVANKGNIGFSMLRIAAVAVFGNADGQKIVFKLLLKNFQKKVQKQN